MIRVWCIVYNHEIKKDDDCGHFEIHLDEDEAECRCHKNNMVQEMQLIPVTKIILTNQTGVIDENT